jgi:hypothetical protein
MFEDLIKEMSRLDGQSVSIEIETDEKDYIDKQCPSEDCEFLFKVNEDDWTNIFIDEAVWCPFCRHEAPADQWFTNSQIDHAQSEALAIVQGKINNALRSGAQKFNRKQPSNSFISMSMSVKGGIKRTHTIPAKAAEAMQLEIECEECNSQFAVIGSAYFCPACGYNSVLRTFSDSLRKIKAKKDSVSIIREALAAVSGVDDAELTCRSIIETCITDGVVAFQKYCDGLYLSYGQPPFNVFQRLDQGSQLWKETIGKEYTDWITDEELGRLQVLYQRRHILSHSEGIVDEKYLEKTGDIKYKIGQRIVVSARDIEDLLSILEKLSNGLEEAYLGQTSHQNNEKSVT